MTRRIVTTLAATVVRHHVDSSLIDKLATYNAERSRGIMHTPQWQAEMAELQGRFDTAMAEVHDVLRGER